MATPDVATRITGFLPSCSDNAEQGITVLKHVCEKFTLERSSVVLLEMQLMHVKINSSISDTAGKKQCTVLKSDKKAVVPDQILLRLCIAIYIHKTFEAEA